MKTCENSGWAWGHAFEVVPGAGTGMKPPARLANALQAIVANGQSQTKAENVPV